jgi:hypothetical protein
MYILARRITPHLLALTHLPDTEIFDNLVNGLDQINPYTRIASLLPIRTDSLIGALYGV